MSEKVLDRFEYGFRNPSATEKDYKNYLRANGLLEPLPDDSIERKLSISERIGNLTDEQKADAYILARGHGRERISEEELDFVESDKYQQIAKERSKRWKAEKEQTK